MVAGAPAELELALIDFQGFDRGLEHPCRDRVKDLSMDVGEERPKERAVVAGGPPAEAFDLP